MGSTTTTTTLDKFTPIIHLTPVLSSPNTYSWYAHNTSFINLRLPALAINIASPPRDEASLINLRRQGESLAKELSRHGATKAIVLRLPGAKNNNDAVKIGKAFEALTMVVGLKRFAIEASTPEAAQSIGDHLDPVGAPAMAEKMSARRYEAAFDIKGKEDALESVSLLDAPIEGLCLLEYPVLTAGQL